MAHKTMINGTAYDISGGADLIAGTKYQIGGGKTRIAGTGYDISFAPGLFTVEVTGGKIDGTYYHMYLVYGGVKYAAESVEIPAGSTVTIKMESTVATYTCKIYLNGSLIKTGSKTLTYNFPVTRNYRVAFMFANKTISANIITA